MTIACSCCLSCNYPLNVFEMHFQLPHQLPAAGPADAADAVVAGVDDAGSDADVIIVEDSGLSRAREFESRDSGISEVIVISESDDDGDEVMEVDVAPTPPEVPVAAGPVTVMWFRSQSSRYARMDPDNCPDFWDIADQFVGM